MKVQFLTPGVGAQQSAQTRGSCPDCERLKNNFKIAMNKVDADMQLLSNGLRQVNGATEQSFGAMAKRLSMMESAIAQIAQALGGQVEHTAPNAESAFANATTVEAANAKPGDENLPSQFFEGVEEDAI